MFARRGVVYAEAYELLAASLSRSEEADVRVVAVKMEDIAWKRDGF